jgi:hypothetical protein
MSLNITYEGTIRGKRLYSIYEGRDRVFTGTLDEVKRYLLVRTEKSHRRIQAEQAYLMAVRTAS